MADPGNDRLDPDRLLQTLEQAQSDARRGRLRIYFGACAGVGKTYAMLAAARAQAAQGVDVVAGLVETHGRADTAALLDTLPALPLQTLDFQGRRLREFDLQATV
ncbi:two-component sensor histidine kinase, partial [Bordetella pertussis]